MKQAIGILLAGLMVAGCTTTGDSKKEKDNGDEIGAEVMCEEFVKDRLKAPSTADFSDEKARSLGGPRWDVSGSVDAENSFGAPIRMQFRCDLKYMGNDKWRAKTVAVN